MAVPGLAPFSTRFDKRLSPFFSVQMFQRCSRPAIVRGDPSDIMREKQTHYRQVDHAVSVEVLADLLVGATHDVGRLPATIPPRVEGGLFRTRSGQ